MIKGKEIVEIGRFVDGKVIPVTSENHEGNTSNSNNENEIDNFKIRYVDKNTKPIKNQK